MILPTGSHFLDWMLSMILAVPIVMFRRGSIDLFSLYIPLEEPYKYVALFIIGSLFVPCFFLYPMIHKKLQDKSKTAQVVITRITVTIGSVLLLTYWRGVWGIADHFTDVYEWQGALISLVVVHGIMAILQTSSTLVFTPFFLSNDEHPDVLVPNLVFSQTLSPEPWKLTLYTLDVLFTHFINNSLVVLWFRHMFKVLAYLPLPQENFGFIVFVLGFGLSLLWLFLEIPLAIGLAKIARWDNLHYRGAVQGPVIDVVMCDKETSSPDICLPNSAHSDEEKSKKIIPIEIIKNPPTQRKVLRFFSLTKNEYLRYIYMELIFSVALFSLSVYWLGILEIMKLAFPDLETRTWFCFLLGALLLLCGQGISSNGLCGCSHDLDFIYPRINDGQSPHFYNNLISRYLITVYEKRPEKPDIENGNNNIICPQASITLA